MTREAWLGKIATALKADFRRTGNPLPEVPIRVSCGWPTHKALASASSTSRTIGQCFSPACSSDGTWQIFVSPYISQDLDAAAVIAHELCHTIAEGDGHGSAFKRVALSIGLTGKMTATTAGPALTERLNALIARIGRYPHATLDASVEKKTQGTRLIKIVCPECGYTARTTQVWILTGLPTCPCGGQMDTE